MSLPDIELPNLPPQPSAKSIVLQPSPAVSAALERPLPPISAWEQPQKPVPKALVLPARSSPTPAAPVFDAPPTLNPPGKEPKLSDLSLANLPSAASVSLPRPPAATAPVRVLQLPKPLESRSGGGQSAAEDAAGGLIIAGSLLAAPGEAVAVPSVLARPIAGIPAAPPSQDISRAGGVPGTPGAPGSGSGPGGQGSAGKADGFSGSLAVSPPEAQKPLPALRIERPPEGRYNFLVLGIDPVESFPETAGIMRCKLAYTVYLRIGVRPDWTLLFCPQNPGQDSFTKIDPPYAYLMLRPDLEFGAEDRVFVHGVLNPSGKLEQLVFPGSTSAQNRDLLSRSLAQWQFRPALRGAQPAAVEVLFIIPRPEP